MASSMLSSLRTVNPVTMLFCVGAITLDDQVKPPSVELKAGVAAGASASLNTGSGINASAGTSATAGASLQGAQPSIRLRS